MRRTLYLDRDVMTFSTPSWEWEGAPDYKNDRLAYYQQQLMNRGVTEKEHLKILTAQLIQEAGSLSEWTIGDSGCSVGILQYNACVHHGISGNRFLQEYPEWQSWTYQMDRMADMVAERYELYDDIKLIVVHHNSPAAARRGQVTRYWHDVAKRQALLTDA